MPAGQQVAADLEAKRDRLAAGLTAAGLTVLPSHGTYFLTVDISASGTGTDGIGFCRGLVDRCRVAAIPTQVFYDDPQAGRHLVRFAFCKRPQVLDEAVARLSA